MPKVHLWSGLRDYVGGARAVEVDGKTTGELRRGIVKSYPGLEPFIEAGVSFAIDGRVIAFADDEPVSDDNEIYLLERITGG